MIPNRGSNIEDVMSTLRQADEKYQDATVSVGVCVCVCVWVCVCVCVCVCVFVCVGV